MISPANFKSQFVIFLFLAWSVMNGMAAAEALSARRTIVIDKAKKNLILFTDGKKMAEFPASFGIDPDSDKRKAFDCATPEGLYFITYKKTETRFHRLLGISYPSLANAEKGLTSGVISLNGFKKIQDAVQKSRGAPCDTGLGCGIALHGGGVFRYFDKNRERDWTEGCVALNNNDMENLFDACRPKDRVIIFNSRRNLYGIIRPFTRMKNVDGQGLPVCPDGICTYEAELPTALGRTVLTLREGKKFGRSIQVFANKPDAPDKPFLTLLDSNADGHISFLDSVSGPAAENILPDAAYVMVREAVIEALCKGIAPLQSAATP